MVMVHSACLFKFRYIVFKFRHMNGEFTRRFGKKGRLDGRCIHPLPGSRARWHVRTRSVAGSHGSAPAIRVSMSANLDRVPPLTKANSTVEPRSALASLLERAEDLAASLSCAEGDRLVVERLRRSVIRPLSDALGDQPGAHGQADDPAGVRRAREAPAEGVWELALDVTRLRLVPGLPSQVQEAVAALQDLACQLARDAQEASSRLDELGRVQSELSPAIQVQSDGPYLVTNAGRLPDWLGEPLPARPQMALCRCGASQNKPF